MQDDPLNEEYHILDAIDKARVDAVIADARACNGMTRTLYGRREYYCYPHPGGGWAWGVEEGRNIRRGVVSNSSDLPSRC